MLGVGTNNSLGDISTGGGHTWASLVNAVVSSADGREVASQVTFWGANDIEAWYSNTSAVGTKNWASGFNSTTAQLYVDFGSADGCPTNRYTSGHGYICRTAENAYFTQYSYWYLSWGNPAALPVPEIYNSAMGPQWSEICQYGVAERSSEMIFQAPLSDHALDPGSLSPSQSWAGLWNALSGTTCAQTPAYMLLQENE